jgi:hypothetical protein
LHDLRCMVSHIHLDKTHLSHLFFNCIIKGIYYLFLFDGDCMQIYAIIYIFKVDRLKLWVNKLH